MTEARSLADRIDPRKQIAGQSHHGLWLASDLDLIAASDALRSLALPADLAGLATWLQKASSAIFLACDEVVAQDISPKLTDAAIAITALSARVAELEAQATEYATRLDLLQFAANQADFKKRAAEAQASLARRLALEETLCACETVYDRHAAAAKVTPEFAWKASADHCCDAIRALSPTLDMDAMVERVARSIAKERGDQLLFENTLEGHKPGQHCEECDASREGYRIEARAVLSALLEGGMNEKDKT